MRLKICKKCGKIIQSDKDHPDIYLCPECSLQAKRDSVYREHTCKTCGTKFMGYPRSMFCPKCSGKRKKERAKKYRQNGGKPMRPLGSVDHCEICGKEYVVNSGRQRFCPDCADLAIKGNVKELKKQYYSQNKEEIFAYKKEMRSNRNVCVICGKVFDTDVSSVTCSPKCAKELRKRWQSKTDLKRGKRKTPTEKVVKKDIPHSGVVGVTWRSNGKWMAMYKKHYIGVYDTIEDASNAIDNYKKTINI